MKIKRQDLPLGQGGYIGLVMVAFLIVLSMVLYPWKLPSNKDTGCRVGEAVDLDNPEIIMMPPIINVGKPRDGHDGGWDTTSPNTEYVLIRKNVPVWVDSKDPNVLHGYPEWMGDPVPPPGVTIRWGVIADADYLGGHADTRHTLEYKEAGQQGFDVYYPNQTGEVELPYLTKDRTGQTITITHPNQSILTLRTEGFLMFVRLGPDGKPIKINYGPQIYYLVDFYQDKAMYETPDSVKGYNVDDIFHCLDPLAPAANVVIDPLQDKSLTKEQLQLEWFKFDGKPGMYVHCKPAVYLYPQSKQLVNVKVFPRGELSYTDPPYDKENGWTVFAEPNGRLNTLNNNLVENGYLYYESKIFDKEIEKPTKGWVIKFSELEGLFDRTLLRLGLNKKEADDFNDYWLKQLPDSPYYFVGLIEKDQRDHLERLEITPKPDTSIRFSFFFEMLDHPKQVEEPNINTPDRNGFTLVDWGGMIKLHKDTPFTCSQ